jgi:hypothetical protein
VDGWKGGGGGRGGSRICAGGVAGGVGNVGRGVRIVAVYVTLAHFEGSFGKGYSSCCQEDRRNLPSLFLSHRIVKELVSYHSNLSRISNKNFEYLEF